MAGSELTKKDFANWINQTVGQDVVNEQAMDQLLQSAKKSYSNQGLNGLFEYMRQLTMAPISNKELRGLMEQVLASENTQDAIRQMGHPIEMPKVESGVTNNLERSPWENRQQRRAKKRGS